MIAKIEKVTGPLPSCHDVTFDQAVKVMISVCIRDAAPDGVLDEEAVAFRLLVAAKHRLQDAADALTGR